MLVQSRRRTCYVKERVAVDDPPQRDLILQTTATDLTCQQLASSCVIKKRVSNRKSVPYASFVQSCSACVHDEVQSDIPYNQLSTFSTVCYTVCAAPVIALLASVTTTYSSRLQHAQVEPWNRSRR
jgi:hypothetical protein